MDNVLLVIAMLVAGMWLVILLLPWQPWRTREVLEVDTSDGAAAAALDDVTVVIPARNEAAVLANTLQALTEQGAGLKIIVVDDHSSDNTAEIVLQSGIPDIKLISCEDLPYGWSGKLWAQEQGLKTVNTAFTLLLDADIQLQPGIIATLKNKMSNDDLQLVSLMAVLPRHSFLEKLLMPVFIYFFKMLYPFALANRENSKVAAAAGGCILVYRDALREIGGMAAIRDAVIDDCSLAKKIKAAGYKTWLGLTHAAVSQRPYSRLSEIWEMVARTAYSQLNYSIGLLLLCTLSMFLLYLLPLFGLFYFHGVALFSSIFSLLIMSATYIPTLRFYSLNFMWALSIPLVAGMYLLMTWSSAIRFWKGERTRWKGRIYQRA